MMKVVLLLVSVLICTMAFGRIGYAGGRVRGAKPRVGKRIGEVMVDRSQAKESTNEFVVAEGPWTTSPGGLFGRKFGVKIPDRTMLEEDRARGERYVSFQPAKKFRKFNDYRMIVDPRTRLVYGLSCVAKIQGREACEKELSEVKSVFRQKFPNASSTMIGYGEKGGGWIVAHWDLSFKVVHPETKGHTMSLSEITIRAIDKHFLEPTPQVDAPPASSADLDAL